MNNYAVYTITCNGNYFYSGVLQEPVRQTAKIEREKFLQTFRAHRNVRRELCIFPFIRKLLPQRETRVTFTTPDRTDK